MTDLARAGARPGARPADTAPSAAPVVLSIPLAALAAAAWAAALGLVITGVLVLVAWVVGAHSDTGIGQALSASGVAWLLEHRAPVTLPSGSVGVLPIGLVVLPLWLTYRAGRWAARAARIDLLADAVLLVAGAALCYGLLAAVVAGATTTAAVSVVPLHALAAGTVVAALGLGVGVVREGDLWEPWRDGLPASLVHVVRAGVAAALTYVALSALLAALALVLHLRDAASVQAALAPGVVGGALLMLLGIGYAPTAVVWAGAYASGPGFVVGEGTRFSPLGTTSGPLPSLPWLAALPEVVPHGSTLLLALPVLAGAVGGLVLLRHLPEHTSTVLLGEVAGVAAVCGGLWALASALCSGGMGPGRLAFAGPQWWQVGLTVTGEALVGVFLVILLDTARIRFQSRPKPA